MEARKAAANVAGGPQGPPAWIWSEASPAVRGTNRRAVVVMMMVVAVAGSVAYTQADLMVAVGDVATTGGDGDSGDEDERGGFEQPFHSVIRLFLPTATLRRACLRSRGVMSMLGADGYRAMRAVRRPFVDGRRTDLACDDRFAMNDRWPHVVPMMGVTRVIMSGPAIGAMIMMTITDTDPDPQRYIRPGCCKPSAQYERA